MKKWILSVVVLGLALAALALGVVRVHMPANAGQLQGFISPGPLSDAHAFLEQQCSTCHTSIRGVEAANCIVCHTNNDILLQRQPTAFHADISRCAECHIEHRGVSVRPVAMDHAALAGIGWSELRTSDPETETLSSADLIRYWLRDQSVAARPATALDCITCHATKDRHVGLFGKNCSDCHGTEQWTIADFRHPSARSVDCAQCHQAPPSHYMEHFAMVSKNVVARGSLGSRCCDNVQVNQCYRCHQTTAWNDLRGVGYYKHH
ncbi:MAG: hypothetical protein K2X00_06320 [Nitrospiraceae bacterium]|uniref:hypothetical protein n=1 Tax=Nitrospira cf. moscoviensis SBR1015 TaxID=96242 RepID=UPI000A0B38E5|nr:hypothetical protein [Nitrospira cf. moscoviensis SBR1015]MBX9658164.1 hypothetical protein [Nitrospiraceae bacterium]OQW30007.1 MAG: hypothetical protein A4E20_04665 [Nitrospira sp. SG-bin2]